MRLKKSDIVIAAVGVPEMIKGSWIKPGATVIDVGINRIEKDGKKKLVGDVEFSEAEKLRCNYSCSRWSWPNDNCLFTS